jgi:hypothetical protein
MPRRGCADRAGGRDPAGPKGDGGAGRGRRRGEGGTLVCSAPAARARARGRRSPNPIVTHMRAPARFGENLHNGAASPPPPTRCAPPAWRETMPSRVDRRKPHPDPPR